MGKVIKITSEHKPNAHIGKLGIQRMLTKIEAKQTLAVDAVSGATYSTTAFLKAARKAVAVLEGELSLDEALGLSVNLHDNTEEEIDSITTASITSHDEVNPSVAQAAIYLKDDDKYFDEIYDVIIAGSGGDGLSAAVEAARGGLKTLVCEKAGIPGGTTNASGGVIQAAGTKYQKKLTPYQDDTPTKHVQLWVAAGEGNVNEDLVWDLALGAPHNIEWLAEMGLNFDTVYGHAPIPYVAKDLHADRIHQYENGGDGGTGTLLILALLKEYEAKGGAIEYDCPVIGLIQAKDTHEVIGAVVQKEGELLKVKANLGVVLATASVDHNPALAKELNPQQYFDIPNSPYYHPHTTLVMEL